MSLHAYETTVSRMPSSVATTAFAAGRKRAQRDHFMHEAREYRRNGGSQSIVRTWVQMARSEHRSFLRDVRELQRGTP